MRYALLFTGLLLAANFAAAAIYHVPDDYPTIQAGVNAAPPGDTVLVAPGTYGENVTLDEGTRLFGSGMDVTIIDGGGITNVVTSPYNVLNLTIQDLTVRNSQQGGSLPG